MNKADLINAVASSTNHSRAHISEVLDALIEQIKNTVASGEPVTLVGFGTFELRSREARTGRNPRTGEAITIEASKSPAFKPGKSFKDLAQS